MEAIKDSAAFVSPQNPTTLFQLRLNLVRSWRESATTQGSPSTATQKSFFDLPPEFRCLIYNEYFRIHTGHMVTRYGQLAWFSRDGVSTREVAECRSTSIYADGALGPMNLLLASKSVHAEAYTVFLYTTAFMFDCPANMFHFVNRHTSLGSIERIQRVIINFQNIRRPLIELKQMIELVKSMPSLLSAKIHFNLGDWVGCSRTTETKLAGLRHFMFGKAVLRRLLNIKSIVLRDPDLEKDMHALESEEEAVVQGSGPLLYDMFEECELIDAFLRTNWSVSELQAFNRKLRAKIRSEWRAQDGIE